MKSFPFRLLPHFAALAVMVCPSPCLSATKADFAGKWKAEFQKTTFCKLDVETGDTINGTISVGDIHTDEDGNLQDVTAAEKEHPLQEARVEEGALLFDWTDDDGEVSHLEFTLVSKTEGRLRFVDGPAAFHLKPFQMKKQ